VDRPVALITGGSKGIGAACVREFVTAGWRVSVLTLADGDLSWMTSLGVTVTKGDVTSREARETAVQQTLYSCGRIDVLINNAGVGLYGLPTEVSPCLFSRLLDVNVVAPLALAQLVIPVMINQGTGTIVTMGSVAARVALPWAAAYSASKSALLSLHDSLRIELQGTPIHLLKVYAGIVDTEFREHVLTGEAPDRVRQISYVIPPATLAAEIYRAIQKRRRTLYLPAIGRLFGIVGSFAPLLMDLYLARMLSSTPLQEASAVAGEIPEDVDARRSR
jgi:short-subunit dehydrogenase